MTTAKVLLLTACLTLLPGAALADSISGGVNVSGHDMFTTNSLTFVSPFASLGNTGAAAVFSSGTVDYLLGTVNYMDRINGQLEIFTITDGSGDVLAFYSTDNNATSGVDPNTGNWDISLKETGFYTINGGTELPGYIDVSFFGQAPDGSGGPLSFSSSGAFSGDSAITAFSEDPAITPEPSSVLLFGTVLLSLAALALRSRVAVRSEA